MDAVSIGKLTFAIIILLVWTFGMFGVGLQKFFAKPYTRANLKTGILITFKSFIKFYYINPERYILNHESVTWRVPNERTSPGRMEIRYIYFPNNFNLWQYKRWMKSNQRMMAEKEYADLQAIYYSAVQCDIEQHRERALQYISAAEDQLMQCIRKDVE